MHFGIIKIWKINLTKFFLKKLNPHWKKINMSKFAGKTAVISGGAEGIGFSIAQALGDQKMNIVIADIDEEKLKLYGVHAKSTLEANAGRYVARGSNISKLEGIPPERCTILEFESVEAAKAFYACEDYQGAKMKLDGKVDRVMFIIEGV